jgi:hypothetical protein
MSDWYSHYNYLVIGVIFFSGAVVSTCTGKTWGRYSRGLVCRAKEPKVFWGIVATYYVGGVVCIGTFLLN